MRKHERNASRVTEVSATLVEDISNVRDCPGWVVSRSLNHESNPVSSVPFIHNLFEIAGVSELQRLVDGILDLVLGHVHRAGILDGSA